MARKKAKIKKTASVPAPTELARACARVADDKKASDILILDLRRLTNITDFFVIAGGTNPRQLQAISRAVNEEMAASGLRAIGIHGESESRWVLHDYGSVVVHLFDPEYRKLYDLELLWGDAKRLNIDE